MIQIYSLNISYESFSINIKVSHQKIKMWPNLLFQLFIILRYEIILELEHTKFSY